MNVTEHRNKCGKIHDVTICSWSYKFKTMYPVFVTHYILIIVILTAVECFPFHSLFEINISIVSSLYLYNCCYLFTSLLLKYIIRKYVHECMCSHYPSVKSKKQSFVWTVFLHIFYDGT